MKFNGGLAGGIANLVQSSVQESIKNELAKLVCNEISKLDDDNGTFDDMLGMIEERIDSMMLVVGTTGRRCYFSVCRSPSCRDECSSTHRCRWIFSVDGFS